MNLRVSKKHGLNPSIAQCYFCGDDKNELVLLGQFNNRDDEAPQRGVFDKVPCDTCKGYMKQGIILIGVREDFDGKSEPHRTGQFLVVTEDFIKRILPEPSCSEIINMRMCYVPESFAQSLLEQHENKKD